MSLEEIASTTPGIIDSFFMYHIKVYRVLNLYFGIFYKFNTTLLTLLTLTHFKPFELIQQVLSLSNFTFYIL